MTMALMGEATRPSEVLTIVTRACIERTSALAEQLGSPVRPLVLDDDGDAGLRPLLGGDFERFVACFDRGELALAVLPRLLSDALERGAPAVAWLLAGATAFADADLTRGSSMRVDPWPLVPGRDRGVLDAVVIPATDSAHELLARWRQLADTVLEEDRTLTPRTTLRWLGALAPVVGIDVVAAGIASAPEEERECGGQADEKSDYGFAALGSGLTLTTALRRLLRRAQQAGRFSTPLTDLDSEALLAWLAEPVHADPYGWIPRYLDALLDKRPDVVRALAAGSGDEAYGLQVWVREHGSREDPILRAILDLISAPTGSSSFADIPTGARVNQAPWGVNAVGYWQSELGIADAGRLVLAALAAGGVPAQPIGVQRWLPPARQGEPFVAGNHRVSPFGLNLLCLNPDGVLAFRDEAGAEFFAGRPTIAYWWWELVGAFPEEWRPAIELVDEIWVGSQHVRDAIAPAADGVPVEVLPIPVLPLPAGNPRAIELPAGFLFLTVFDYNSAFERKNPLAVVDAFKTAFEPGRGAVLLVKSINAVRHRDNRDELAIVAADHPDIHLLDGYLSSSEMDRLIGAADCVVSLHRAEGLGLPLARAMRSGIPVVATAYGGNLDFMTEENSYLVPHRPAIVPDGTLYPPGARWVEPDTECAAAQLRRVFDHPREARDRAARGSQTLASTRSPAATGAPMAQALRRHYATLAGEAETPTVRGGVARRLAPFARLRRRED
jgi:glycosyltransferase involved in cell wall biosynthesis